MSPNYDVLIIGASIAGSTAAYQIAATGRSVLLIDKVKFPRQKACGEGLSWRGAQALSRMGLGDALARCRRFRGYSVWLDPNAPVSIDDRSESYTVSRFDFDQQLLARAQALPLVELRTETQFKEIEPQCSRIIIDASGQGVLQSEQRRTRRFGKTFHVRVESTASVRQVHIFPLSDGEIYCTPVDDQTMNVNFLGYDGVRPPKDADLHRTINVLLEKLGLANCSLISSHGAALSLSRRSAFVSPNIWRIGDCCEQLDPIGGMGMAHALLSSEIAARLIVRFLNGDCSMQMAMQSYARERERMVRPLRSFTSLTFAAMRSGRMFPAVGRQVAALLGPRLAEVVHHPERATLIERGALQAIGGIL